MSRSPAWSFGLLAMVASSVLAAPVPVAEPFPGEAIETEARRALAEWLSNFSERHTIELARGLPTHQLPAGDWTLEARAWAPEAQPHPRTRVWVDINVAGQLVRSVPVDFRVQAFAKRWVMQRDAVAGQALTHDDVALELIDLTQHTGVAVTRSPVGLSLTTPVRTGQVLRATQVERPPAVARGSDVTMRSRFGAISLTTTARALQNGQPGQRIRVQPAGASTWIEAQVVSASLVEVTP